MPTRLVRPDQIGPTASRFAGSCSIRSPLALCIPDSDSALNAISLSNSV